eukprot:PhM_4_TR5764/c0_g1_i1/m.83500
MALDDVTLNATNTERSLNDVFDAMIEALQCRRATIMEDVRRLNSKEAEELRRLVQSAVDLERHFATVVESVTRDVNSGIEVELLNALETVNEYHVEAIMCPPYSVAKLVLPTADDLVAFVNGIASLSPVPGTVLYPRSIDSAPAVDTTPVHLNWDTTWKAGCMNMDDRTSASCVSVCGERHHLRSAESLPVGRHYFEIEFSRTHGHCESLAGVISSGFSMLEDAKKNPNAWVVHVKNVSMDTGADDIGFVVDTICHHLHVFANGSLYTTFPISNLGPFYAYAAVCCHGASARLKTGVAVPPYVISTLTSRSTN